MGEGSKDLVAAEVRECARGVVGSVCGYLLVFLDRWRPFPGTAGWQMPPRCRRQLSASRSRPKRGPSRLPVPGDRRVLNMGPSALERRRKSSCPSHLSVAAGQLQHRVLSLRGGIGKTSTTVGVGLALPEFRGAPPCDMTRIRTRGSSWNAPSVKVFTSRLRHRRSRICSRTSIRSDL